MKILILFWIVNSSFASCKDAITNKSLPSEEQKKDKVERIYDPSREIPLPTRKPAVAVYKLKRNDKTYYALSLLRFDQSSKRTTECAWLRPSFDHLKAALVFLSNNHFRHFREIGHYKNKPVLLMSRLGKWLIDDTFTDDSLTDDNLIEELSQEEKKILRALPNWKEDPYIDWKSSRVSKSAETGTGVSQPI